MFNFFKKPLTIIAPISGKTINLNEVPDPVFAEKMAGDGIAINSTGDIVVAPCDGTISLIMDSGHAFAITTNNGIELLVHVGLETVSLNGEGFEVLKSVNTKVTAGTPILKLDRSFIESKGISLITPVLVANPDKLKELNPILNKEVCHGKDIVMECKL
ncbi:PTS sugar transporter subunit IIA [Clostridium beijerinckii]|jgi:PTS system D-glucosamine-specific IIA component/PTS system glucose-specific IIA component|uniref:PTS glucose transporter subunit IIA n=1 Tax=Clostridium beijerinckii TaxID=1520 RepID=A0AAW3W3B1_CLOBE|nr:PTS glucose transporter subunit IIA [Clostridium beijerinckii]MBC2455795.1 PTS glucose transporter subunit IIA [Clostridium beijerinckii]MBC2473272.1 PTS glucose transporter subunit IIA [Clostridium beijerinckii]MCI1477098.1 PTS glucose transporter subunit IIA [Clostridium beijerinckii]MCI1577529.1 PTS glucose transporter subunit IIA [Clostridium beijerinckii]MCI1585980.1 PTS glucose transporter subunit IIA [Clostridium beijerinckii]